MTESILETHKEFIGRADAEIKALIERADAQLKAALESPKSKLNPQSTWIKAPDGEELLVLNRDAVEGLKDLLKKVDEVIKLIAKARG